MLAPAVGQAAAAISPNGSSSFTGSAEGWTGKGTCTGGVTLICESTVGYDAENGNPAGSLDAKSTILVNAAGLVHSEAAIQSPSFIATEGGTATLRIERQFVPGGLLPLTPRAAYTVTLVDQNGGGKQQILTETVESGTAFTAESGTATLVAGRTYAIGIETEINSTVAAVGLLGSSDLRFDNVSLTVAGSGGGSGGGRGTGNGGNGGNGAGGVSSAQLASLLQSSSLIGPAVLKGNRITVKAKCPAKLKATCTLAITGMLSKKKAATTVRKAKVRKAKTKSFVLKVRPAALKKVKAKKKLLFKEQAKVGKSKATIYKTLKLIRK
ncbi:MAG TPA: hypothetical protein VN522_10930 [Solirubrobacterales bacterium]|nr:hypothetical protein [Solirubrobacterales bacterium]